MTGDHGHPYRGVLGGPFGQAPQVTFRFNRHHLGDRAGVVAEVHAVARADLDHPAGQAGQHPVPVLSRAPPLRFGAHPLVHAGEPRVLKLRQIRHAASSVSGACKPQLVKQ